MQVDALYGFFIKYRKKMPNLSPTEIAAFLSEVPEVWTRAMHKCPIPGMKVHLWEGKPLFYYLPDLFGNPYCVENGRILESYLKLKGIPQDYNCTKDGEDNSAGCYLTFLLLAVVCAISAFLLNRERKKERGEPIDRDDARIRSERQFAQEAWMYSCVLLSLHYVMVAYRHYYIRWSSNHSFFWHNDSLDLSFLLSVMALGCRFCTWLRSHMHLKTAEECRAKRNMILLQFLVVGVLCLVASRYHDLRWLTFKNLSVQHDLNHILFVGGMVLTVCGVNLWSTLLITGIWLGVLGSVVSIWFRESCSTPCPFDCWFSPKFNHNAIGNSLRAVGEVMITMALMTEDPNADPGERASTRTTTSSTTSNSQDSLVTKRSRASQRRSFQ